MTLDQFREAVVADTERERTLLGEGLRKAFIHVMAGYGPDEEADNLQPIYYDGRVGAYRTAVDGWAYDDDEHSLLLVVADFNQFEDQTPLTKTEADVFLKRLRKFFEACRSGRHLDGGMVLDFSSPEYELAELIRTEGMDRIRLQLYTDRTLSGKFKTLGNEPLLGIPVEEDVWTIERLYEFHLSGLDHEPLTLDFEDHPIPLRLATTGEGFRSYLGVIDAVKLATVYREHGGRLLEGNVRAYLMLRTSVNKSIRGTILAEPEHFFIYNNGIAVTARDLVFNEQGELIRATDFQIINGGQTTASLARVYFNEAKNDRAHAEECVSKIQVAIKLTEIDKTLAPEEAQKLVRCISRYSNNQNKISDADLTSNHEFHVRMEQMATRITAPPEPGKLHGTSWFYERSRGSYMQKQMFMSASEMKAFQTKSDKRHVIRKEDVARARLLWEQKPDVVSKGAARQFSVFMSELEKTWDERQKQGYYGDQFFKDTISLHIIHAQLRAAVLQQPWYNRGGYLAAIVVYAISAFSWLFAKENPGCAFNFEPIWRRQDVPDLMMADLLQIAEIVQAALIDPGRDTVNVTEWAKKPRCWVKLRERLEKCGFKLHSENTAMKLSEEEQKQVRAVARANTVVDNTVELVTKAFAYQYWTEAASFNSSRGVLSDSQKRAVQRCALIPRIVPTNRDVKTAMAALELLRLEGFTH